MSEIIKEVPVNPPEAKIIAKSLRSISNEIGKLSNEIQAIRGELDDKWIGKAKKKYISKLKRSLNALNALSKNLDSKAREIEFITVIQQITDWVGDIFDGDN